MTDSSNRIIGHNALMLATRMAVFTLVGMYTSRVKLEAVGITDYGILGVVATLVAIVGQLHFTMTDTSTRFITLEVRRHDTMGMRRLFASSLYVHVMLILAVFVLAQVIGVPFVNNCLDIPADRMTATNWVFEMTVLTLCANIYVAPYHAIIFAHERMGVYAAVELVNAVLKLGVVFLIATSPADRLILLVILDAAVSLVITAVYIIYCRRRWTTTRVIPRRHRATVSDIARFFYRDLYRNVGLGVCFQGFPIVINWFFGLAANTGAAIAMTLSNAFNQFTDSISRAFSPRIIKEYGQANIGRMSSLMFRSTLFTALAMTALAVPCWLMTPWFIRLWLGQEPEYAVAFTRLAVAVALMGVASRAVLTAIHATGHIGRMSLFNGTLYLLTPVAGYIIYRLGAPANAIYYVLAVTTALIALGDSVLLYRDLPAFPLRRYLLLTLATYLPLLLLLLL